MQRGGMNLQAIHDHDFKYTTDRSRIIWNKNVFPIGPYLVFAVKTIPWSSYQFDTMVNLPYNDINAPEAAGGFTMQAAFNPPIMPFHVRATNDNGLPYYFFGGSVYEILHNMYRDYPYPDLHRYVDPTGDLDIHLRLPTKITVDRPAGLEPYTHCFNEIATLVEHGGGRAPTLSNPLTMNALVDDYTRWVMDQLYRQLMIPVFSKLFGAARRCNYRRNFEASYADIAIPVGNLWLVRTFAPPYSMIKIQLLAQFEGMTEPDHILEFVIPCSIDITLESDMFPPRYPVDHTVLHRPESILDGIPVESISRLINGNRDSISNRYRLWNTDIRHKFYNHVGRLQYLNQLLPHILYLAKKRVSADAPSGIIRIDESQSATFGDNVMYLCVLLDQLEAAGHMCKFDFRHRAGDSCDPSLIRLSMTENIVRMLFWTYTFRRGTFVSTQHGIYGAGSHVYSVEGTPLMIGERYLTKEEFFNDFLEHKVKHPRSMYIRAGATRYGRTRRGGGRRVYRKSLRRL
jgi:hypothetical protein